MITLYYHLFLGAGWQPIAAEYLAAVRESGLPGKTLTVGLVGAAASREYARDWWLERCPDRALTFIQADQAWEHLTLRQLWADARELPPRAAMCYAHAKGVYRPSTHNTVWRQSMTRRLIRDWAACVPLLECTQAVGCHWLTLAGLGAQTPVFGGNFWWARAGYIATLPDPDTVEPVQRPAPFDVDGDRHTAERWIGLNRPEVTDRHPVWPGMAAFTPQEIADAEAFEMSAR